MLFAYRSGKNPISAKAWRKLDDAERKAGILPNPEGDPMLDDMPRSTHPSSQALAAAAREQAERNPHAYFMQAQRMYRAALATKDPPGEEQARLQDEQFAQLLMKVRAEAVAQSAYNLLETAEKGGFVLPHQVVDEERAPTRSNPPKSEEELKRLFLELGGKVEDWPPNEKTLTILRNLPFTP